MVDEIARVKRLKANGGNDYREVVTRKLAVKKISKSRKFVSNAEARHSRSRKSGINFVCKRSGRKNVKMNKSMYLKASVIFMAAVFLFSSCASIVSKSSYPLSINSTPSGAEMSITDKKGKEIYVGNTPAVVELKAGAGFFSRAEYQVRFSSPGYNDKIVPVTFKLDGWYFGNILLGGLIGMLIVDPATGAMWKMETEFLNETLLPTIVSISPEMQILNINDIPEDWKEYLVQLD
ncbi:MAG: hypothetical protein FWH23_03050 [Bacteroidales bacterium]|nr:hypothetical protein [Bacteroidales bacterium]